MRTSITVRGARIGTARIILTLLVSLLIAACASGASAPILSTVGNAVGDENAYAGDVSAPSAAASAAPAFPVAASGGGTQDGGDGVGAVDDARIVRTGTIELQVQDVPRAVGIARDAIRGLGGYIGASNTFNEGEDQPVAEITYRIPVARWEDALAALRSLNGLTKKVVTEQTNAVEVTGQIVDLEARIRNLRASESALQAIDARATKISDVLDVQAQLTDVRGQIEQLTGQLTELGNRADLATLTATYRVQLVAVEIAQKGWDPTAVVDEASASMVDLLQSVASAGIWFAIVWLPILVTLLVLGVITLWVLRRLGLVRRGTPPLIPPALPPAPPSAPIASEG
jgi:Domain of unknown function (DUF4349)